MDPNLFHINWDRLWEVLVTIAVLAILIERALALVFEHRLFMDRFEGKGVKEFIALLVSLFVCWKWDFDVLSIILVSEHTSFVGQLITAGVIAGGSKGSVKLFREMMGLRSRYYDAKYPRPDKKPGATGSGTPSEVEEPVPETPPAKPKKTSSKKTGSNN